jgi:1-acyl-sn-glycerol-3-phosphate acyltransferase
MFNSIIRQGFILLAKVLSGASVRYIDCTPDTCQRIYFANHTSHLDALVIWASLPGFVRDTTRMVAARDYWEASAVRRYISTRLFNALLIDREQVNIHNTPVKVMLDGMGDKYSLIIFPEGGRSSSETGEVGQFKSGLYHLVKKRPDLELIPVCLNNMNRILPRGRTIPVPMLSRITFGPPIWLEKGENRDEFLVRAREAVIRLAGKQEE